MDKGADDSGFPGRWYAGDAPGAGSAQQVHQYKLGIVIRVMTKGNLGKPLFRCRMFIESIAGTSAGFLKTAAFPLPLQINILSGAEAGQIELAGNCFDKIGIAIRRFPPQCMVKMSDPDIEVLAVGKSIKDMQKGYRISTSRDTHENPVARLEHFSVGYGTCNGS